MSGPLLKDAGWVRQSFLVNKDSLEKVDAQNRIFSTASNKFTDTSLGGNLAINPPAQFTRTADLKAVNEFSKQITNKGMGRYYSEAIDDNAQIIYMRFGVPAFNSLTTFFAGFYNSKIGSLARTGRIDSTFYTLGRAATLAVALGALGPVVAVVTWGVIASQLLGRAINFALGKPTSKFYYLKPAMPLYWNAVQTMVNQIAVNRKIIPRIGTDRGSNQMGDQYQFDDVAMSQLVLSSPEIFKNNGQIDVYAVAGRAQRLARRRLQAMHDLGEEATSLNLIDNMNDLSTKFQKTMSEPLSDTGDHSFLNYLKKWGGADISKPAGSGKDDKTDASENMAGSTKDEPAKTAGLVEFLETELDDGSAFASFRVNQTGHISESFSNTVADSELQGKVNSASSSARSTSFDFANGNLGDGVIASTAGAAISAAKAFISGVGDSMGLSGLAVLGGGAFVDIPKHWQSSSASLPRSTYTIELRSPYGNPISQLQNLYIPLCMLLAGALPISTGRQSWTSPFLVELYDKGRCQTRLGMIDSLSITRGVGNLGFDNEGNALGIDISFSVIDMSSVLHMPISQGFSMDATIAGARIGGLTGFVVGGSTAGVPGAAAGAATLSAVGAAAGSGIDAVDNAIQGIAGVFDDDTVFTDYMNVLGSVGLADQIYQSRKFMKNLTTTLANWKSWYSISHYASFLGDTMPARLVSAVYKGVAR